MKWDEFRGQQAEQDLSIVLNIFMDLCSVADSQLKNYSHQ